MLSPSYDPKKVYVHASEFTRTVMTAKIALTAAYSPATEWCENMQLLPIECNEVPQDQDIVSWTVSMVQRLSPAEVPPRKQMKAAFSLLHP